MSDDSKNRQRIKDIAAAGGWHLLTDEDTERLSALVENAGGLEVLTTEQADEIFRGTGKISREKPERAASISAGICSEHQTPDPGCQLCLIQVPGSERPGDA